MKKCLNLDEVIEVVAEDEPEAKGGDVEVVVHDDVVGAAGVGVGGTDDAERATAATAAGVDATDRRCT